MAVVNFNISHHLNEGTITRFLRGPDGKVARYTFKKGVRVQNAAKRKCRVDTGRLRASIAVKQQLSGDGIDTYIGTDVEYAAFLELGTRYMRAYPYLVPALKKVFK